jgi:hypothetical protein
LAYDLFAEGGGESGSLEEVDEAVRRPSDAEAFCHGGYYDGYYCFGWSFASWLAMRRFVTERLAPLKLSGRKVMWRVTRDIRRGGAPRRIESRWLRMLHMTRKYW